MQTQTIQSQATIEDLPEFLSPTDLMKILKLGRTTVYQLLNSGAIPHMRFGKSIRIPKHVLELESGK